MVGGQAVKRNAALQLGAIAVLVGGAIAGATLGSPAPPVSVAEPEATAPVDAASTATAPPFQSERDQDEWTANTLDEAFRIESRDEAWASPKEAALRALAGEGGVSGVRTIDAECRSAICKVRVAFAGRPSLRTLKALQLRQELRGGGYHALDRDGAGVTLYLAREGTDLASNAHFMAALAAL
jgi:hypothetical protein